MHARLGLAAAFAIYMLAALSLFCTAGLLSGADYLGCPNDPSLYIWMFQFLPDAIEHFRNIFVLKAAWAPVGLNITQATTTPLLAILAWPITALVGPVIAFNLVAMSAPAFAATSGFAFAGTYTKNWLTKLIAGWIIGFSTAVISPMSGHLQTYFIAFVPLAFLIVSQRAAGAITFKRCLICLTAVIVAQFLVSLEIFVTEALFLSLFVLVIEANRPGGLKRLARPAWDNLFLGLIAAYAATAIIVSPFLYSFLRAYSSMPPLLQDGGSFPTDLTSFIIPTPVTWLGGMRALPISKIYAGNWSEDLGYIGAPLLIITLIAAWRARHDKRAWPLLAILVCGFIAILGPRLYILGRPTIFLPWALMEKLPLLGNAVPGRMMVFVLLGIAGFWSLWVANLRRHRWLALLATIAAAVFVLPGTSVIPAIWSTPFPTTPLFSTPAYRSLIHRGDTVLFLPFSLTDGNVMFWQAETKGYFKMVNGYGNFVPAWYSRWPAIQSLEEKAPRQNFPPQFNLFAQAAHIKEVIMPVPLLAVWRAALEQAGWHPQRVGNLAVFAAPPAP